MNFSSGIISIVKKQTFHTSRSEGGVSFQFIIMQTKHAWNSLNSLKSFCTNRCTCAKFCCVNVIRMQEKNQRSYFWIAPCICGRNRRDHSLNNVTVFQASPPVPPSVAQKLTQIKGNRVNEKSFYHSLKVLIKNVDFTLLLGSYGMNIGAFYAYSTLLNQLIINHFPVSSISVIYCTTV